MTTRLSLQQARADALLRFMAGRPSCSFKQLAYQFVIDQHWSHEQLDATIESLLADGALTVEPHGWDVILATDRPATTRRRGLEVAA